MDVIAGRKTTGIVEHDSNIFVNGQPKDPKTFASITGYVEQTDMSVYTNTLAFLYSQSETRGVRDHRFVCPLIVPLYCLTALLSLSVTTVWQR